MDSSIFMRSRLTSPFPSLLPPAAILAAAAGAPALAADADLAKPGAVYESHFQFGLWPECYHTRVARQQSGPRSGRPMHRARILDCK
jgi:hypothetical protein